MSHVGEAYFTGSVELSSSLGIGVRPVPDENRPDRYLNIRLSNGTAFYTAGGTSVSGGAVLTADQGAPNLISAAWPIKITDGASVFGPVNFPFNVVLSSGGLGVGVPANPLYVSGTVSVENYPQQSGYVRVSGTFYGVVRTFTGSTSAALINQIVPAQGAGVKIRVLEWQVAYNSPITLYSGFYSDTTQISAQLPYMGTSTNQSQQFTEHGHFETQPNQALNFNFIGGTGAPWGINIVWIPVPT